MKDRFVPWWMGFVAYWMCSYESSFFKTYAPLTLQKVGWRVFVRTPLLVIRISKCARCWNKDGYESGVAISWFPARWSLRMTEGEFMYRHERSWMNFIPRMAIRGLR